MTHYESQTPLGERVPSAAQVHNWKAEITFESQTPLGERVPSAWWRRAVSSRCIDRLKPLSGNVCLRPGPLPHSLQMRPRYVSNPSRGTCAFGRF